MDSEPPTHIDTSPAPPDNEQTLSSESPGPEGFAKEPSRKSDVNLNADATSAPKPREWAALPHPLLLILTVASVLTGTASSFTAWFNYQEARRNNRQPPEPTVTAFLVRPPEGVDTGEIEVVVRNDGKVPARSLNFNRAMGIALRPSYRRGGSDPDRFNALMQAEFHGERQAMLQSLSTIVKGQFGYHDRVATVDFLGAGQTAPPLRIEGNYYLYESFRTAISKEKGYLAIGLSVSYLTPEGVPEVRSFCFERHPPFTAPAQKESLPQCTEGFTFLFGSTRSP